MYCPRCGNQPTSDRVRFCPSCGFRLDGVADLLVRDGVPANSPNIPQTNALRSGEPSERKQGIRRGAKMVFSSMAMFLPVVGFCALIEHGLPLILPGSLFLAGIFWMIYYRLFGDENAPAPKRRPEQPYFGPPPQNASLPPPQSVPVYRSPVETPKEHSVVEHTTRSLERQ
jgi:zinc-ribbon domain